MVCIRETEYIACFSPATIYGHFVSCWQIKVTEVIKSPFVYLGIRCAGSESRFLRLTYPLCSLFATNLMPIDRISTLPARGPPVTASVWLHLMGPWKGFWSWSGWAERGWGRGQRGRARRCSLAGSAAWEKGAVHCKYTGSFKAWQPFSDEAIWVRQHCSSVIQSLLQWPLLSCSTDRLENSV